MGIGVMDEDFQAGLECYDPEERLFPKLARTGEQWRGLSKRDILLILKWKLGRIKEANLQTIKDEAVAKINEAVAMAENPDKAIAAVEDLISVPGIGLATATAILTICYPDRFTIIDERVLGVLELVPSGVLPRQQSRYTTPDWNAESYIRVYVPRVQAYRQRWGCSLRDTDRALWGLSVSKQIKEFIDRGDSPLQADRTQPPTTVPDPV